MAAFDVLDEQRAASGDVVTGVRLGGVDLPAFRAADVLSEALAVDAEIYVETARPEDLTERRLESTRLLMTDLIYLWSGDGQVVLRYLLSSVGTTTTTTSTTTTTTVPSGGPVSCAKVAGLATATVVVAKCTPSSKANAKATAAGSLVTGSGTLTWTKSGGTTIVAGSSTAVGQGGCKKGWTEWDVSGTVTGGTSAYTATGDPVSARLCESVTGKVALVAGTSATF